MTIPPNMISVPSIIFDEYMKELSPAEFKLLMCIVRKTCGIFKKRSPISLYEMEKMTTLSRSGLSGSLNGLVHKGFISKFKSKTSDGNNATNEYEVLGVVS